MTEHTLIAIHVEHFVPLELEIETRGFEFGLSERQRQLCTCLLHGRSYADIEQLLSIRHSTVIDHVRKIYAKLDVHSLSKLRAAFRDAGSGAQDLV